MVGVLRHRDAIDMAQVHQHRRRQGMLAGSYVSDLAALGKSVILCPDCRPKFDADAAGYRLHPNLPRVSGLCDGCRRRTIGAQMLLPAAAVA